MELNELWKLVLGELELEISKPNFQTWLKNTIILDQKDDELIIGVESVFAKEWISNKYHKTILKIIRNFSPEIKSLEYQIHQLDKQPSKKSIFTSRNREKLEETKSLDLSEYSIDLKTGLNSKYLLDNFIVGPNNELAYSAAMAVIDGPGKKYNPLFIYGGVGLGKTHLIQGVGHKIKAVSKNKYSIKYLSAEMFVNETIESIRTNKMTDFKNKYRKVDVLIVDDIQFISGKEKTQEEFFHTFNTLYQENKQIIISSDRSPYLLANLEERIKSRFEGGMVADITYPDFETRIAILKNKLINQKNELDLGNDIIEEVARMFPHNVRELEGALSRLIGILKIRKVPPVLNVCKKILEEINIQKIRLVSVDTIIRKSAEFYNISEKELLSHSRKKELVKPRQIVMYLLREDLKYSFPTIAQKLGGRDHTTVLHACKKISRDIINDKSLSQEINMIKDRVYNNGVGK